ncbi:MAG: hypothetical protein U0Q12_01090 [Vicinamibacterales bacterium]
MPSRLRRHRDDLLAARKRLIAYCANRLSHRYGFGCDWPDETDRLGDAGFAELGLDAARGWPRPTSARRASSRSARQFLA